MKILWMAPPTDLENICRSAQFHEPEHGSMESAAPGAILGPTGNSTMLDMCMLAIGLGFFARLVLYGLASERL
jgi:hypothetical protein